MLPFLAAAGFHKTARGVAGAASFIESVTPKLEDEVTVEVIGQPGATKKNLYFLALSTAYGLARPGTLARFLTPPPSLLMLEYDAADNWVRVTVKYKVGVLDFANQAIGNTALLGPFSVALNVAAVFGAAQLVAQMPILNGPSPVVVGATPVIPFSFLNVPLPVAGVPNPLNPIPTVNQNIGRVILTDEESVVVDNQAIPTPNPKPSGDFRSRGSVKFSGRRPYLNGFPVGSEPPTNEYLVPLVFAALSAPGSTNLTTFTPPPEDLYGGG